MTFVLKCLEIALRIQGDDIVRSLPTNFQHKTSMGQKFDPYFELLGIPEEEQPPNCYRLLGIPEFTSNKQVIANGAARQMQFLRRVGGDQFLTEVQDILNEISKVRITLLDDKKRAEYDLTLKKKERDKDTDEESFSAAGTQSHFDLSAPAQTGMGRVAAFQLIHLSGPRVGETISLQARDVSIGPSSKFDVMVPTRNGAKFKLEHEIDQWTLSSEDTSFAINGRLVNGLAVVKDGDIFRLSVEGPDLQFIEEVDVTRHLETLGQHEQSVAQSSPAIPTPAGYADVLADSVPSSPDYSQPSRARSTGNVQPQRNPANPSRAPHGRQQSRFPQQRQTAAQPRRVESKLVKKPKSQQSRGIGGSIVDLTSKALGRDNTFTKKKGASFDWQICVFWLAVGCVLAAIAAGIIFGWR